MDHRISYAECKKIELLENRLFTQVVIKHLLNPYGMWVHLKFLDDTCQPRAATFEAGNYLL